jgi:hypothetical protein
MQVTGFRDVSKPGDIQRLVKWEENWVPAGDGYETRTLRPTIWEWSYLDVSNPRRIEYSGPEFKWVPTAITSVPWVGTHWHGLSFGFTWPREAPTETEYARRDRIMVLRAATHVDLDKGEAEPEWMLPAMQPVMHNPAIDVQVLRAAA